MAATRPDALAAPLTQMRYSWRMSLGAHLVWLPLVAACSVTTAAGSGNESSTQEPAGAPARRSPRVIAEIEAANAGLSARDRASKYCKMAAGPLPFYRGTNHLFWSALAGDARLDVFGGPRTRIWVQGDLHTQNYGAFQDDDGTVIYDLDDFDEAVIANYQWDVWRMAVSVALAAGGDGIDALVDAFSESYLDTLADYAGNNDERSTSFTRRNTDGPLRDFLAQVERAGSRAQLLDAWTRQEGGARVFDLALDDLEPVAPAIAAAVSAAMPAYIATTGGKLRTIPGYFTIKGIARRLDAGLGSLGVPRYYVLIEGESADVDDDRILDLKRQGTPAAHPYIDSAERALTDAAAATPAERTITAFRALSRDADDHLGWLALADGTYSARERSPHKKTFPTGSLNRGKRFRRMAEQWGAVLATAHARADEDYRGGIIDYSFDDDVHARTDGRHEDFRALVRDVVRWYLPRVHADYRDFADHVSANGLCPRRRS